MALAGLLCLHLKPDSRNVGHELLLCICQESKELKTGVHTHLHIYTHIHSHTDSHTHKALPIHSHIHSHMHMHTHIHTHPYICTCILTYTHIYTSIYSHTHASSHIHSHRHTHTHIDTYTPTFTHSHTPQKHKPPVCQSLLPGSVCCFLPSCAPLGVREVLGGSCWLVRYYFKQDLFVVRSNSTVCTFLTAKASFRHSAS